MPPAAFIARAANWLRRRGRQPQVTPEPTGLPPIVVSRRPRHPGMDWTGSRSWFGGRPRLGCQPWPRDPERGRPLIFLAQLDLAELAAASGPTPLPAHGSLAFFVGHQPVLYIPEPDSRCPHTELPPDAPTLEDAGYSGAGVVAWPGDPQGPRAFPVWPVEFTRLDLPPAPQGGEAYGEAWPNAQATAVDRHFERRSYNFSAQEALAAAGLDPEPRYWHSAIHLADCLRIAATLAVPNSLRVKERMSGGDPKLLEQLAKFRDAVPEFERFAADVAEWTRNRDPWTPLDPGQREQLAAILSRTTREFRDYSRYAVPHSPAELTTVTLLAAATGEDRAYLTLPEPVRELINRKYRLPIDHWHQVFGAVIDIQGGAAEEAESKVLLLRLNFDDMLHWGFGDNGAYHFFLPPADLKRRNWDAATMIFECH